MAGTSPAMTVLGIEPEHIPQRNAVPDVLRFRLASASSAFHSDKQSEQAGGSAMAFEAISPTDNLGFDPDALKKKYLAERDKRLRRDGNEQYVEMAGKFAH